VSCNRVLVYFEAIRSIVVVIWYILWSFGIFCGHLVYFVSFGIFCGHLVYFVIIWYVFPVSVCCTKKFLATLVHTHIKLRLLSPWKNVCHQFDVTTKTNLGRYSRVASWCICKPKITILVYLEGIEMVHFRVCIAIWYFYGHMEYFLAICLIFYKVFHPIGVVLFPSSHHSYNYKLQLFYFRCGASLLPLLVYFVNSLWSFGIFFLGFKWCTKKNLATLFHRLKIIGSSLIKISRDEIQIKKAAETDSKNVFFFGQFGKRFFLIFNIYM
jgi:hypothetical protein